MAESNQDGFFFGTSRRPCSPGRNTHKIVTWIHMLIPFWLVVSTPLKNMKVSWDDDIPNIWKNEKCSKPQTSISRFEI